MSHSETITRNDLTNILNEVIPTASVNYVVETHIEPLTIATNDYVEATFTTTKSGYFPLGIVGYRIGWVSGDTGKCNIYSVQMTDKSDGSVTVAYAVYNVTSASVSMNFRVDILWAKVDGASASFQADYIVEQGTSGNWTYRKWNSGISECWATVSVEVTSYQAWGNQYYSTPYCTATFPTDLFVSIPVVTAIRTGGAEGTTVVGGVSKTGVSTMYILRPIVPPNGTLYFSVCANGTWK